ncbi:MAG TPA: HIT family protein [Candidatus Paceibacterota bacterium]|nr:HIT family protein [Candidatus Paceibacterota bacterium]
MDACPFCTRDTLALRLIAENETAFAIPTNIPITSGHTLVCPKRHVRYYEELTAHEQRDIESLRVSIKHALVKSFGAEGFNWAWNEERVGGQSVPHFHLHIVPRREGDTGVHGYEPRKFIYRPGARDVSPDEELRRVAREMRDAL